jgi:hypothetical protein
MERHLFKGLVGMVLLTGVVLVLHGSEQPVARAPGQGTNAPTVSTNDSQQAWKLMEVYFGALAKSQITNANVLVPQIMALGTNDWNFMYFFSWRIFADRNIRYRDRPLALTAAQRALQLRGEKEAGVLDTYARALFENGKHEQAIETETKAVQVSTNEAQRIEMEANLHRYARLSKQAKR